MLNKLFVGSCEKINASNVIIISAYYSTKPTGANIRYEKICSKDNGILGLDFCSVGSEDRIQFKSFWAKRWLKYIAIYLFLIVNRGKKIIYDVPPLIQFSRHYYLIHDAGSLFNGARRSGFLRACFFRIIFSFSPNIVSVSYTTLRILNKIGQVSEKSFVSYNGVEIERTFQRSRNTRFYDFCLITSGDPHKRDIEGIALLKSQVKQCKIVVVTSNSRLKSILENEHPDISVFSNITECKKFELLQNSKFYFNYSIIEGFGIPIIEAAICGARSIVINSGINRELGDLVGSVDTIPRYESHDGTCIRDIYMNRDSIYSDLDLEIFGWDAIRTSLIRELYRV